MINDTYKRSVAVELKDAKLRKGCQCWVDGKLYWAYRIELGSQFILFAVRLD